METIQDKAFKVYAGKYIYANWTIEFMPEENHWLMFPPNEQGATDAAQTLRDAKAMIDYWEDQEQHRQQWAEDVKKELNL
jgi:hypothetical protein